MSSKAQFDPFLIAFVIIFVLFRGIAILLANADWTLVMLLICAVVMTGSALATNLFFIPMEITTSFSLMWIGVVLVCLFLVFVAGRLFPVDTQILERGNP